MIAAGRNVDALVAANVDAMIALGQPEDVIREPSPPRPLPASIVVVDYLWGRPTELVLEALAKGFRAQATHRTRLVEVGRAPAAPLLSPLKSCAASISPFLAAALAPLRSTHPHHHPHTL